MPDYRGLGGTMQGLGEFLQSLANANDPEKAKRDELERRLMVDPDLASRLQENPTLLAQLVGSKNLFGPNKAQELIDRVNKTKLTPEQLAKRTQSGAIAAVQNYNNQAPQNAAVDATQIANSVSGVGAGASNVPVPTTPLTAPTKDQRDIYNRQVGLPTTDEQAAQKLNLQHLQNQVNSEQTDLNEKTQLRKLESTTRAYLSQNKLDPYSAFKNMASLPPDVQQGLTSVPSLQEAIKNGQVEEHFNKTYELEQHRSSSRFNQDLLLQAAQVESAKSLSEKLGVPINAVFAIQKDPTLLKKYSDPNYQPQPGDDPSVVDAAKRMSQFSSRYSDKQLQLINQSYSKMRQQVADAIASGKEKNPQAAVNGLNANAVALFGGFGIAPPIADYDPHRFSIKKPELTFSDYGDPRLGYAPKAATPNSTPKDAVQGTDPVVDKVVTAIQNGDTSLQAALSDSRLSAAQKQAISTKASQKSKK